jgi:hypothetical protein
MTYEITLIATIESEEYPEPDDFYINFNNNLPYSVVDESVEVQEVRE